MYVICKYIHKIVYLRTQPDVISVLYRKHVLKCGTHYDFEKFHRFIRILIMYLCVVMCSLLFIIFIIDFPSIIPFSIKYNLSIILYIISTNKNNLIACFLFSNEKLSSLIKFYP